MACGPIRIAGLRTSDKLEDDTKKARAALLKEREDMAKLVDPEALERLKSTGL